MAEPTFDELKAHDLFCHVVDVVREGGDDSLAWKPIAQALADARAAGFDFGLEHAARIGRDITRARVAASLPSSELDAEVLSLQRGIENLRDGIRLTELQALKDTREKVSALVLLLERETAGGK